MLWGQRRLLLFAVVNLDDHVHNADDSLPVTVGGWPLHPGGGLLAPSQERRGMPMLTYSELFQFCLVLIGIVNFGRLYQK